MALLQREGKGERGGWREDGKEEEEGRWRKGEGRCKGGVVGERNEDGKEEEEGKEERSKEGQGARERG